MVGAPALLFIGLLAWPLVFSGSTFTGDWPAQLWFLWKQSMAIKADHLPSLFLNYPYGVLYPEYAFYGGTLYALTGTLSLALGNTPVATYVLTYLLGFAAAYGGWYWISRIVGLGRWWSHVPGLVFITSAYYLTLIYARGDWPEYIAVSTIPLMVASGLSVLRADRLRLWPALVLTLSSVIFSGSHSLTLVWGSTTLVVVGLAIVACVPQVRSAISRAGVIRVAGLVVPAVLTNAWFLLPATVYESSTRIATEYPHARLLLQATMPLVSVQHLFTLSRASASTPGAVFALSLPILVMAWALISLPIFLWAGPRGTWTRIMLICAGFTVAITVLMTHAGLILALPRAYSGLQFSYRLESYVLLGICATILGGLVLARNGGRRVRLWLWTLVPLLAVSVVGGIQQTAAYPHSQLDRYTDFHELYTSPSAGGEVLTDYLDVHLPVLSDRYGNPPQLHFAPGAVNDNRISAVAHLHPGQLVETNLQGPPSLVHITGAKIVGISVHGYDVLEIAPNVATTGQATRGKSAQAEVISLSPANGLPVVLGRIISVCALIALALQFLMLAARRRRVAD